MKRQRESDLEEYGIDKKRKLETRKRIRFVSRIGEKLYNVMHPKTEDFHHNTIKTFFFNKKGELENKIESEKKTLPEVSSIFLSFRKQFNGDVEEYKNQKDDEMIDDIFGDVGDDYEVEDYEEEEKDERMEMEDDEEKTQEKEQEINQRKESKEEMEKLKKKLKDANERINYLNRRNAHRRPQTAYEALFQKRVQPGRTVNTSNNSFEDDSSMSGYSVHVVDKNVDDEELIEEYRSAHKIAYDLKKIGKIKQTKKQKKKKKDVDIKEILAKKKNKK